MTKRTRASVRRARKTHTESKTTKKPAKKSASKTKCIAARKSVVAQTRQASQARRRTYTPELLAYARHRFEQTDDPVADIGLDLGISDGGVWLLAKREHWKRYVRPPRGLPPGVKLQMETAQGFDESGIPALADTIARLHRAVLDELAAIESLRMRPRQASSFAHTTRTLASLTETLQKLQRLQPEPADHGPNDADIPTDIDEFRNELARRIEAFVTDRTDAGACGGAITCSMDAAI